MWNQIFSFSYNLSKNFFKNCIMWPVITAHSTGYCCFVHLLGFLFVVHSIPAWTLYYGAKLIHHINIFYITFNILSPFLHIQPDAPNPISPSLTISTIRRNERSKKERMRMREREITISIFTIILFLLQGKLWLNDMHVLTAFELPGHLVRKGCTLQ